MDRFGNQENETCFEKPFVRVFNYICDAANNPSASYVYTVAEVGTFGGGWDKLLTAKGYKPTDTVCVFKPKVQVLDNWGWCTGSCEDVPADVNKKGCYSEKKNGVLINDECDRKESSAWKEFSNIIVVAP